MAKQIPLRNRTGAVVAFTLVDDEDYEWLNRWRWSISGRPGHGVAARCKYSSLHRKGRTTLMHRIILGLDWGNPLQGDHINRDRLDNRRSNLRIVTSAQNCQNQGSKPGSSSRFRGVTWDKHNNRWRASVRVGGKQNYLGSFRNEIDAANIAREFRLAHMTHTIEGERYAQNEEDGTE